MKFKPGTFATIPNIHHLKGQPAALQSIFLWLCAHMDDNGRCFPMRATIAEESGCDIKTVDKYISVLEEGGFIEKTKRKTKAKKQNSNLYQIMILTRAPKFPLPGTENGATPGTENGAVTKSKENYTHLTIPSIASGNGGEIKEAPFVFKEILNHLKGGGVRTKKDGTQTTPRHDFKVIALYWAAKGFTFENRDQYNTALKRELKAAGLLKGYSGVQIAQAISYCKKNYDPWTLETVGKRIADIINKT